MTETYSVGENVDAYAFGAWRPARYVSTGYDWPTNRMSYRVCIGNDTHATSVAHIKKAAR